MLGGCVVVVVVVVVVMAVAHPTPLLTASSLAICRLRLINTSKWDWCVAIFHLNVGKIGF